MPPVKSVTQLLLHYQGNTADWNLDEILYIRQFSFREAIGHKVVNALKRNDFGLTHAAIDMICALMHPMHDDYDLRQEQLNKSSLLQTKAFLENLLNMWTTHIVSILPFCVRISAIYLSTVKQKKTFTKQKYYLWNWITNCFKLIKKHCKW